MMIFWQLSQHDSCKDYCFMSIFLSTSCLLLLMWYYSPLQYSLRYWLEFGVSGFGICDTDAAFSAEVKLSENTLTCLVLWKKHVGFWWWGAGGYIHSDFIKINVHLWFTDSNGVERADARVQFTRWWKVCFSAIYRSHKVNS